MIGIHAAKISHVLDKKQKRRKTMLDAIKLDCETLKLSACQIFVQGPRNANMSRMDYSAIKSYCEEKEITLVVHASYVIAGMFSLTPAIAKTDKGKYSLNALAAQLDACDKLGAIGLVVHITKKTPDEIVVAFKTMMPMLKKYKTPIIIEQPAKKPDDSKTYETPEKINKLTDMLVDAFPNYKWGWCIDTCHLWAAGIDVAHLENWLSEIKSPKKIALFHINGGMKKYFGTGKDTHIIPFASDDAIWTRKATIKPLLKFAKKYNIPCICEINRGDKKDAISALNYIKLNL